MREENELYRRDRRRFREEEKKAAQRGGRTHDIEIKSLTLYRLS